MKTFSAAAAVLALGMLFAACGPSLPRMETVRRVDIPRFMGNWYVIASIPTWVEEGAHNAVESYRLDADGTVGTTFTFRKGGFDGPVKTYRPRGFILDTDSNAVWGMQFLWPIKSEYRIIHLDDEYSRTVIGRSRRDYVWIMARTPDMEEAEYRRLADWLGTIGYDTRRLQRIPHRWPDPLIRPVPVPTK